MSRSSESQNRGIRSGGKVILFQRNQELSECARVLDALGFPGEPCTTGLPSATLLQEASLVIASAQRLLESGPPHLSRWPRTIAVVDESSKTLSSHLNRIGVSMILCRPIHPRALRLILLHEVYRGPERRNRSRTLIGHGIRIGSGFLKTKGTLLELSRTGARIQMPGAPQVGTKLRIHFDRALTKGRALKFDARVVRCSRRSPQGARTESEVGLSILEARRHTQVVRSILDRFGFAPPPWKSLLDDQEDVVSRKLQGAADPPPICPDAIDPPPAPADAASDDDAAADPESEERRGGSRIVYDRRIVALGEEAARVLVGRDLSCNGLRIEANESISAGDVLRIALHGGMRGEPLVIMASVLRDDGEEGVVLRFEDISSRQLEHLEKIIADGGPILAAPDGPCSETQATESFVVGEMLGRVDPDPSRSRTTQ